MSLSEDSKGCEFCSHPLYVGTKCKNCGRVTEQPAQPQEPKVLMQEIARLHDCIKDLERDVEFLSRPAQRKPWVGLTLDDREKLRDQFEDWNYPSVLLSAVENILREKNA